MQTATLPGPATQLTDGTQTVRTDHTGSHTFYLKQLMGEVTCVDLCVGEECDSLHIVTQSSPLPPSPTMYNNVTLLAYCM